MDGTVGTNGTWVGWFTSLAVSSPKRIFSYTGAADAHLALNLTPRLALEARSDTGAAVYVDGPFGVDDGRKHHFAVVKEGSALRLYYDGAKVAQGTVGALTTTTFNANDSVITVEGFEALTTALTDAQVHDKYVGAPPAPPPDPTPTPTPTPTVTHEELWLTDPRIGIEMNKADVDQGPKLLAACDLALTGDGALRLNPGFVENRSVELAYSRADKMLHLKGCGASEDTRSGSSIIFPVDFGPGKYAFKLDVIQPHGVHWEDFLVRGPNTSTATGSDVSNMHGPKIAGRCHLENITVQYFREGLILPGDHQFLVNCTLGGNSYAVMFAESDGMGYGDFKAIDCHLEGCRKASIGIGTTHGLANFLFLHGHAGFSPYGVHRFQEQGQYRGEFMRGGWFFNMGFEACDSCAIYDELENGSINRVRFTYPGEAGGYVSWAGKPQPKALWQLGALGNVVIDDASSWTFNAAGNRLALAWLTQNAQNVTIGGPEVIGHLISDDQSRNPGLPPVRVIDGPGRVRDIRLLDGPPMSAVSTAMQGAVVQAVEPIARWDAVEMTEQGEARKARNAYPYLGQALAPADRGQTTVVATAGWEFSSIHGRASQPVSYGRGVVVDPANPGMLKPGPGPFGPDVVAYPMENIAAGGHGQVNVMNSQAA